jgi:hypothetical protein
MMSSGMLRRVALVRTDVSEELSASFIRVTRTTRRNISQDTILHSHRRENLKSNKIALSNLTFSKISRLSDCNTGRI